MEDFILYKSCKRWNYTFPFLFLYISLLSLLASFFTHFIIHTLHYNHLLHLYVIFIYFITNFSNATFRERRKGIKKKQKLNFPCSDGKTAIKNEVSTWTFNKILPQQICTKESKKKKHTNLAPSSGRLRNSTFKNFALVVKMEKKNHTPPTSTSKCSTSQTTCLELARKTEFSARPKLFKRHLTLST